MTRYVAFLRAVNVGGNNMVPMKPLAAALAEQGFADVKTYLNSGNVILTSSQAEAEVAAAVSAAIEKLTGHKISVAVRSTAELGDLSEEIGESEPLVIFFTEDLDPLIYTFGEGLSSRHALLSADNVAESLKQLPKKIGLISTSRYARVVREVLRRATTE